MMAYVSWPLPEMKRQSWNLEGAKEKKKIWMKDRSTQPPREAEPMSSAGAMAVPQLTPDPIQNVKCDPPF